MDYRRQRQRRRDNPPQRHKGNLSERHRDIDTDYRRQRERRRDNPPEAQRQLTTETQRHRHGLPETHRETQRQSTTRDTATIYRSSPPLPTPPLPTYLSHDAPFAQRCPTAGDTGQGGASGAGRQVGGAGGLHHHGRRTRRRTGRRRNCTPRAPNRPPPCGALSPPHSNH